MPSTSPISLIPANSHDYREEPAVLHAFHSNQEFRLANSTSLTTKSELASLGVREVVIRFCYLRKLTKIKL